MERRLKPPAVIGLDVGGTFIKAGLVDRNGGILARLKKPTEAFSGKQKFLDKLSSILRTFDDLFAHHLNIAGAGIGVPGIIDLGTGVIASSPNFPGWNPFPIRRMLAGRVRFPFFLENDANAAALGEMWMGSAKGAKNFCFITLGTGVGGGLVLNGEVWHGIDGMAGEVGHMTVDPSGPICLCGNHGCLEAFASANALRRTIKEDFHKRGSKFFTRFGTDGLDGELVHRAAKEGDPLARAAFAAMGTALGIGIANLVNLLNLERIVLGGGLSAAWKFFFPALREELEKRPFAAMARRAKIVRARVGEDAGILGGAYLAWRELDRKDLPQRAERGRAANKEAARNK